MTVENCCDLFTAVHSLCGDDFEEELCVERRGQQTEEVKQSPAVSSLCRAADDQPSRPPETAARKSHMIECFQV